MKRLHQLCRALAEVDNRLHFIGSDPLPFPHRNVSNHVLQIPFAESENILYWLLFASSAARSARTLSATSPIHRIVTFGPFYTALCAGAIRRGNIPAITFVRADNQRHSTSKARNLVFHYLDMLGIKLSRRVVFVNSALRNTYQKRYGLGHEKSFVLPNNIDSLYRSVNDERDAIRHSLNIPPDSLLLSTMGDINRIKNHEHIIHAMARLNAADVHLLIVGDDLSGCGERVRIETLADSIGIGDHVHISGWHAEPLRYIAASDLFVFPSRFEGSPNALLEALSCGIPCIGSDIAEIREVLQHDDLMFKLDDGEDLAARLRKARLDAFFFCHIRALSQERCREFMFDWSERAVHLVTGN